MSVKRKSNYEQFLPYRWHPCKGQTEIEQCPIEEADFFGVYLKSLDGMLTHLFDCYAEIDAQAACSLLQKGNL